MIAQENPLEPSAGNTVPRRRSSLQFEKQKLEQLIAAPPLDFGVDKLPFVTGTRQQRTGSIESGGLLPRHSSSSMTAINDQQGHFSPTIKQIIAVSTLVLGVVCVSLLLGNAATSSRESVSLQQQQQQQQSMDEISNVVESTIEVRQHRRSLATEREQLDDFEEPLLPRDLEEVEDDGEDAYEEDDDDASDSDSDDDDDEDDDEEEELVRRDLAAKKKKNNNKKQKTKPTLAKKDLLAWQRLYGELDGANWKSCNDYRNPCNQGKECAKMIKCKVINGKKRIVAIKLNNNRLKGYVPGADLAQMDALRKLDLSNDEDTPVKNQNRLRPAIPCFDLGRCVMDDKMSCAFDNAGMDIPGDDPEDDGEVRYCLPTSWAIDDGDLQAWQDFYNATNGESWTHCSNAFRDPCSCREDEQHYVMCDWFAGNILRITALSLADNNLNGEVPESFVQISEARLVNLAINPNLTGCLNLPQCRHGGIAHCTTDDTLELCGGAGDPGTIPDTKDPILTADEDLAVWRAIYDGLGGPFWQQCEDARTNPCSHPECVTCELSRSGKKKIVAIQLADNGLTGDLPIGEIASLAPTLKSFDAHTTDAHNTDTRNLFTNEFQSCLPLPSSIQWNLENSGLVICPEIGLALGDRRLASTVQENQLLASDLDAFRTFYNSLGGSAWTSCKNIVEDPCGGCPGTDDVSLARVMCGKVGKNVRIVEIVLRDSNLQGEIPIDALNRLDSLAILDLSNTPFASASNRNKLTAPSSASSEAKCLEIQPCRRFETFCSLQRTGLLVGPCTEDDETIVV